MKVLLILKSKLKTQTIEVLDGKKKKKNPHQPSWECGESLKKK
jgi:hypothetical protein